MGHQPRKGANKGKNQPERKALQSTKLNGVGALKNTDIRCADAVWSLPRRFSFLLWSSIFSPCSLPYVRNGKVYVSCAIICWKYVVCLLTLVL